VRRSIVVLVTAVAALTIMGCSQPAVSQPAASFGGATAVPGTSWVLRDLSGVTLGTGVPTIDFGTDGTVSGSAGCNTFNGTYTVEGSSISFGPLASTKMACPEADMAVETAFLAGLAGATSWSIQAEMLKLEGASTLNFTPA